MGNYTATDRERQVKWELQKRLADFAVEYKKQNRKKELKEHKKLLFWAYAPATLIIIYIIAMIPALVLASGFDWKFYLMIFLAITSGIAAVVINLVSTIRFMMYACDNPKIVVLHKVIWVIAFFYFNIFIFPLYFHEHILYQDLDAEKEKLLCAWEESGEEMVRV